MGADLDIASTLAQHTAPRRRFAVGWRDGTLVPRIWPVGILDYSEHRYSFAYVRHAEAIPGFRPLLEFPELAKVYVSGQLFPFFSQRVMDSSRPDYAAYLEALALPEGASQLDVLGRSGGRRKADDFQLIEVPPVGVNGQTSYTFLVHGVRYSPAGVGAVDEALSKMRPRDPLSLVPEPNNPVNPNAILVCSMEGVELGWVPDLLVPYVTEIRSAGEWHLDAVRVNGPEVASHLRLVAGIQGALGDGAQPFSDVQWELAAPTA